MWDLYLNKISIKKVVCKEETKSLPAIYFLSYFLASQKSNLYSVLLSAAYSIRKLNKMTGLISHSSCSFSVF